MELKINDYMTAEEQIKELIIIINYIIDSIDARATDPRRLQAKETSTKLLEKLEKELKVNREENR